MHYSTGSDSLSMTNISEICNKQIVAMIISTSKLYYLTIINFMTDNRKNLKLLCDELNQLREHTKKLRNDSCNVIANMEIDTPPQLCQYYMRMVDAAGETGNSLFYIYKPVFEYMDNNNNKPFFDVQINEMTELSDEMTIFFNTVLHTLKNRKYENYSEDIRKCKQSVFDLLDKFQRKQLKRIKRKEVSTNNSMLYFNMLGETKNLTVFTVNMVKADSKIYIASEKIREQRMAAHF